MTRVKLRQAWQMLGKYFDKTQSRRKQNLKSKTCSANVIWAVYCN